MLIRWATKEDKQAWIKLADSVAHIFGNLTMSSDDDFHAYMDGKLSKFEALIAVDRMSGDCLGIIGFSRTHNRITWFGVFEQHRGRGIGIKLLQTALRQLDHSKEITVETFRADFPLGLPARAVYFKAGFVETDTGLFDHLGNPRCKMIITAKDKQSGGSFHYHYTEYEKAGKKEFCPFCNHHPAPDGHFQVAAFDRSLTYIEQTAQGRLFGKGYVILKNHVTSFEEIPQDDLAGFMQELQLVAKALRKVTGAVKINYEIHANSCPHIHCHLFPRYLDDDFPSAPIDYRLTEPSPYESQTEFLWFIKQMKQELSTLTALH